MLLTLTTIGVTAETEVKVSGQVRLRSETNGKSFDTSKTITNVRMMRTRINLDATVDGNAHAFVQFQDSRILGDTNSIGDWQSGGLNDGKNVDIHQAYIQIDRLWFDGFGTKAGRFELNLGNQRVFGAVGWHNVGRTWEGGMSWYQGKDYKVSGFWFKAQEEMEKSNVLANRDFDILGLHAKFDKANLELFGVYEFDQDTLYQGDSLVLKGDKLKRLTFGMYYKRQHNQMDFEFNAAFQTGTMVDSVDISGLMFTGEVGYSLKCDKKVRVAAAIDFSSGDDDPSDSDHKAYNNLYYTGHKFRGHMDYFVKSTNPGLIDIILRGKFNVAPKWTVKGDFHYFKTAADYSLPTATVGDSVVTTTTSTDAGMEFDFSVTTSSVAGVKLVGGLSIFLPQESFVTSQLLGMAPSDENLPEPVSVQKAKWAMERTHTDARVWAYAQTIINF
jgi:hypothetical protein